MEPYVEPWMRGYLTGSNPVLAAVLYSFQQAREELAKWAGDLSDEALWRSFGDIAPLGFHIRHLAGSIDRLTTYAAGESLTEEQFQVLKQEHDHGLPKDRLFELLEKSLQRAETLVRGVDPAQFTDLRYVGRKRIPATLAGLLIHIAEHTQRHVGSAIITAKLARLPVDN
jgi:hypothetical protein